MRRRLPSGLLGLALVAGCHGTPTPLHPAASAAPVGGATGTPPAAGPAGTPVPGGAMPAAAGSPGSPPSASPGSASPGPTPGASVGPTAAPSAPLPSAGVPVTLAGRALAPAALLAAANVRVEGGVGIISDNGGGIVGNNGAGVISDNGGGVVSNHGAGFGLLTVAAIAQVPLAGLAVRLLDAAGKPVAGADGQPLVAVTDARGRYAFTAALPARNLVVAAALPGAAGGLLALAPRSAAPAPPRQDDLDVISTLTTSYILDQYVRPQADPLATLERLPADVEATTRAAAGTALAGTPADQPPDLSAARVDASVAALRQHDAAFDHQMEAVRKLLVVAGLAGLGGGLPATSVYLGTISSLCAAPGGGVLVYGDHTYLVDAAGILHVLDVADPLHWYGAGLRGSQLAFDDQGRPWTLNALGLWRREVDGSVTAMTPHGLQVSAYTPTGGDTYAAVLLSGGTPGAPFVQVDAAGQVVPLPATAPAFTPARDSLAHDASGRLLASGFAGTDSLVGRYDPKTGAVTPVVSQFQDGQINRYVLDGAGNVFYQSLTGGAAHVIAPDGRDTALPAGVTIASGTLATRAADGTVYLAHGETVDRVQGGVRAPFAGTSQQLVPPGAVATSLALHAPGALGVAPDGTLYVLDAKDDLAGTPGVVIQIAPDGTARQLALAVAPTKLRVGGDGKLYVAAGAALYQVDPAHPEAAVLRYTAGAAVWSFVVDADGTLYVAEQAMPGALTAVTPAGAATPVVTAATSGGYIAALTLAGPGRLLFDVGSPRPGTYAFTAAGGVVARDATAFWPEAVDAHGRSYGAYGYAGSIAADALLGTIDRHDPATGTTVHVVGPGGLYFAGTGVDDGVDTPLDPGLDARGNLYFLDRGHKQIKKVDASALP